MLRSLNDSSIKVDTINGFSHQHLFKTQPKNKGVKIWQSKILKK